MTVPRDNFSRAVGVPWFVSWHAQPLVMLNRKWAKSPGESIKQVNGLIGFSYRFVTKKD
jgi:hypothetical protein